LADTATRLASRARLDSRPQLESGPRRLAVLGRPDTRQPARRRDIPPTTPSQSAPTDLRVVISYRRADTRSHVNGIYDGLATRLPDASIFMDLDSIPAGVDFEAHIRDEISRCHVVLVIIGDDWPAADPATGQRRLDNPDDFVRLEIESALQNATTAVVPILVEGAHMPSSASLPESVARLARINALHLDDTRWRTDLDRLVTRVTELGAHRTESRAARAPQTPVVPSLSPGSPERRPESPAVRFPAPDQRTSAPLPMPHTPVPGGQYGPYGGDSGAATTAVPASRMSGCQIAISVLMCVVPVATCALLAWITPLLAASNRVGAGPAKTRLRIAGAAMGALTVGSVIMLGVAPVDDTGASGGWQFTVGMLGLLANMIAGVCIGVVFWRPSRMNPPIPR